MNAKAKVLTTAIAMSLLAALTLAVAPDDIARGQTSEKLTVRFTWKLKGEYAPLYVALQKGYYNAEGLDVQLSEGNGAQNVLKALASGNENFGYGPAVAAARAVSQGLPVKVVALYQTSAPMAVIAFPDTPLKGPKDIEGKRLAISVGETFGDMIRPFTRINNIDLGKVQLIQMDASARTSQFLTRKVDIMSVYLSNELPQIEKRAGVKFNVIKVTDFGLNVLGASMYVSNAFAEQKPDTVKKLLRATAKGYRDAMADPKAAAKIMASYMAVPEQPDVLEQQVEATMVTTNAPAGKPIGWQSEADWRANLDLLKETGDIDDIKPLSSYFTNAYLQ
ncbi:MAG TPA: ABC transporter substrate-binding protein [Xanthobacteraceae bacterium]|jgi:NitT/TauT family transport system substrate-binding protein|nr:ABC transporter substrate-binding protein [Xanthobacteraceae bacterium]